jgi:hypothetical protein
VNIDKWLHQNDSQRYEQRKIKKEQWKADQRRQEDERRRKFAEENDCLMGLKDNEGW